MSPQEFGDFPLESVGDLPNASLAFPGEHWSDRYASGSIVPGEAVVPTASAGKMFMRKAVAGDAEDRRVAIALRTWQPPDVNTGPNALGPNEIMNQTIKDGEYVHAFYSGGFNLTLVVPDDYVPGDLIGWDEDGERPAGKAEGKGAWAKNSAADIENFFEVHLWRPVNEAKEGILVVRSLRTQM